MNMDLHLKHKITSIFRNKGILQTTLEPKLVTLNITKVSVIIQLLHNCHKNEIKQINNALISYINSIIH